MRTLLLLTALFSVSSFALESSEGGISSYNRQTQKTGVQIFKPSTIAEIQQVIIEARKSGTKLKVKASSHSTSSLILSDGAYLSTENLTGIMAIENGTVKVKAGTKSGGLADQLKEKGYSLGFAYPAFRGLTIGGLLATAAHGSSRKHIGVSSQNLVAMTLVDGRGNVRTLTPADGEAFRAAQAHLGLMGVVHDVTLKIYPDFNLQYRFDQIENFLNDKGEPQFGPEADSEIVMWSPMTNKAVKYTGNITDKPASPLATNLLLGDSNEPNLINEGIAKSALALGRTSSLVNSQVESYRLKEAYSTPFIVQDPSVKNDKVSYVGPSSQMLWAQYFQPQTTYTFMEIEFAFPLAEAGAVLSDLRQIAQREKLYFPISRGLFMRFAKSAGPEGAFMSHVESPGMEPQIWVFASIVDYLANGEEPHGSYSQARDRLIQELTQKHRLGLHWGKNTNEIFTWFNPPRVLGSNLKKFQEQVRAFDPDGIFANQFSANLGLR